jgi:signal transduction histidine kinase
VQEAERAVLEERSRIAGELHDVVSHALSAMTVQASAARRLAERNPDAARGAFAAVETTGRDALTELRRLLGVLRREDEELALAPQPSLAHLETLARRSQAAGLPVELTVRGDSPQQLSVGVDLTAYRLIQAALRAARDEGRAGRARVAVYFAPDAVSVVVADDGRAGAVRSLLGMRERVTVYGGDLAAEPSPAGGHVVRARFPVEGTA